MCVFIKTSLIIFLLIASKSAEAQKLKAAIHYEFLSVHIISFPTDVVFSDNSFTGYKINRLQLSPKTALSAGPGFILHFSRSFLHGRISYTSIPEGFICQYRYPYGEDVYESYFSRISYKQINLAADYCFYLIAGGKITPFSGIGFGYAHPFFYREDVSLDKNFERMWPERNELKNTLMMQQAYPFMSLLCGFGGSNMKVYLRYMMRRGDYFVFQSNLWLGLAFYSSKGVKTSTDHFLKK